MKVSEGGYSVVILQRAVYCSPPLRGHMYIFIICEGDWKFLKIFLKMTSSLIV